ncbi:MAG: hypothetical protein ACLUN5_17530 [Oscillospiraceae bacterium]
MALVRCQPPDDLPAKHLFCCSVGVEDKCEKNVNLGKAMKIGSPLFLYRVKAYFKSKREKEDL